jgi:hypothetical protein
MASWRTAIDFTTWLLRCSPRVEQGVYVWQMTPDATAAN